MVYMLSYRIHIWTSTAFSLLPWKCFESTWEITCSSHTSHVFLNMWISHGSNLFAPVITCGFAHVIFFHKVLLCISTDRDSVPCLTTLTFFEIRKNITTDEVKNSNHWPLVYINQFLVTLKKLLKIFGLEKWIQNVINMVHFLSEMQSLNSKYMTITKKKHPKLQNSGWYIQL